MRASTDGKILASKVLPLESYDDSRVALKALASIPELTVPSATESTRLNEEQLWKLQEQGFTRGFCQTMETCKQNFPLRIWIVDNSSSMRTTDGFRLVEKASQNKRKVHWVRCTRWSEIAKCVEYHAHLAALLRAPTQFRLLNDPGISCVPGFESKHMSVAEGDDPSTSPSELQHVMRIMNHRNNPTGVTPLTRHMQEIRELVLQKIPTLTESGQRIVIVIATDGLPSDANGRCSSWEREAFRRALQSFGGLPVWVIIRLCTDDDEVVEYYNDLDRQLDVNLEVLDDFLGEAREVCKHNPWLNYALPLHRLREMGFFHRLFDLLDERPLTRSEIRDFCCFLFGRDKMDGVADPEANWDDFVGAVDALTRAEESQWDPLRKRMLPLINLRKLRKAHGKKGLLQLLKLRP